MNTEFTYDDEHADSLNHNYGMFCECPECTGRTDKPMTESIADFKQRIAIIRRRIETGKEYSIIGASRVPAWCSAARAERVGSGQRTINQDDSTGIVGGRK